MNRVSTSGTYQSALLNLMGAQSRQNEAQTRVSTQKNATDMAGFGRGAESLTTLKAAASRVQGFLSTGDAVAARLETQDMALNQIGDGVTAARAAIANVLAAESGDVLMLELQGQFQSIQNGLNAQHQGVYLFAGGNTSQPPVNVSTMSQLAAAPDVASTFDNDTLTPTSRLGEGRSVQTGYLADGVGAQIFQIFRDIQAYNDNPATGPLTGKPTDAQKAFLTTQLGRLDAAGQSTIGVIARNGSLAKQVETTNASHAAQVESLDAMVSSKTDADLAKALTDLQLAQVAVQASAQVLSTLSETSLLNYLR
ncbi:MAG: flagellin domain protein [Brevundimonas sp.]|nr:flagellin domain protein [Brevundimonas sp.]